MNQTKSKQPSHADKTETAINLSQNHQIHKEAETRCYLCQYECTFTHTNCKSLGDFGKKEKTPLDSAHKLIAKIWHFFHIFISMFQDFQRLTLFLNCQNAMMSSILWNVSNHLPCMTSRFSKGLLRCYAIQTA